MHSSLKPATLTCIAGTLPRLRGPFFVFGVLVMLPWNPIYPGIAALFVAALASGLCRPDLWRNMLFGGLMFLALYVVFLLGLKPIALLCYFAGFRHWAYRKRAIQSLALSVLQ